MPSRWTDREGVNIVRIVCALCRGQDHQVVFSLVEDGVSMSWHIDALTIERGVLALSCGWIHADQDSLSFNGCKLLAHLEVKVVSARAAWSRSDSIDLPSHRFRVIL